LFGLFGWLVRWLVGLVGFVGWSVSLVGWLVWFGLVGWLISLVGWLVVWFVWLVG